MRRFWTPGLTVWIVRHPSDAVVVARAAWRLRARGWWRRWPFLPLPHRAYWDFRTSTVNGSANPFVSPAAVVDAAKWTLLQRVGR